VVLKLRKPSMGGVETQKTINFGRRDFLGEIIRVNPKVTPLFTLSLGLLSPPIPSFSGICKVRKLYYEMLILSS